MDPQRPKYYDKLSNNYVKITKLFEFVCITSGNQGWAFTSATSHCDSLRKKQKIVRRIFRELAFKHSTGACFERLTTPGNRYENTKRTGFAHVRSKGRSGRYYRAGNARQRAGIRAGGHHRAVASSANAHGSRSCSASRLCVGRRPLALGWRRLRMGAGPLAAGTGRRTLGAGSLGATGTELAMDRRSLGSLSTARLRPTSSWQGRQSCSRL